MLVFNLLQMCLISLMHVLSDVVLEGMGCVCVWAGLGIRGSNLMS